MTQYEMTYLELLAKTFPNITATTTEIINLEAIMNLPKGTERNPEQWCCPANCENP